MRELTKGTGKKIMIVVEEDVGGHGFNVYMAGDKERMQKGISPDEMSAAEFWGSRLFSICIEAVKQTGAADKKGIN